MAARYAKFRLARDIRRATGLAKGLCAVLAAHHVKGERGDFFANHKRFAEYVRADETAGCPCCGPGFRYYFVGPAGEYEFA